MSLGSLLWLTACSTSTTSPSPSPAPAETSPDNPPKLQGQAIRFGVLAIDSAVSANERYRPLLDYLETEIGRPFELVPLSQTSQFTEVEAGNLDFTTNNPLAAVQLRRLYNTKFLVTHTRPQTGTEFSGLIVVRADSDIQTLEDLRGKRIACVNFQTAAAGCVFQIYHLLQAQINPATDFASFVENPSQDNIVLAVLNHSIDAGFIRTGQLEKMVEKGLIQGQDALRILEPMADDFAYTHTTALYPEWPIAALPETDPELAAQVREALLKLPPDHPALKPAKVAGFVPSVSYTELDDLIETLQLKSWEAP
ncbi:MAG: phosphate/phosphite/phosphonate ABC transporter substrate-binding protein [Spirulina sp. SIO3F2]|nr:phosphate/phosphite/phosphonate ABC transporter substrate-binding protein [Spirulina sp. SIO3F2]